MTAIVLIMLSGIVVGAVALANGLIYPRYRLPLIVLGVGIMVADIWSFSIVLESLKR